jgi:hypothetical protein
VENITLLIYYINNYNETQGVRDATVHSEEGGRKITVAPFTPCIERTRKEEEELRS